MNSDVDGLKNQIRVTQNYACSWYTKQYMCTTFVNLREDWFLRMKNTHFRLGFTRFLVISGPWTHHYFSRQAREVILMGPRTGNDQKTGKTRRKWVFFILRNQSALKLKKVVHITVYFMRQFFHNQSFSIWNYDYVGYIFILDYLLQKYTIYF